MKENFERIKEVYQGYLDLVKIHQMYIGKDTRHTHGWLQRIITEDMDRYDYTLFQKYLKQREETHPSGHTEALLLSEWLRAKTGEYVELLKPI